MRWRWRSWRGSAAPFLRDARQVEHGAAQQHRRPARLGDPADFPHRVEMLQIGRQQHDVGLAVERPAHLAQHDRMGPVARPAAQAARGVPSGFEGSPGRQVHPALDVIDDRLAPLALEGRHVMGERADHLDLVPLPPQRRHHQPHRIGGEGSEDVEVHHQDPPPRRPRHGAPIGGRDRLRLLRRAQGPRWSQSLSQMKHPSNTNTPRDKMSSKDKRKASASPQAGLSRLRLLFARRPSVDEIGHSDCRFTPRLDLAAASLSRPSPPKGSGPCSPDATNATPPTGRGFSTLPPVLPDGPGPAGPV